MNSKRNHTDASALSITEKLVTEGEGLRLKPYMDTTAKITIGYGRNIDEEGISWEEAKMLMANDIVRSYNELLAEFSFFKELSEFRKAVIADMHYNLGLSRLLSFKKMLRAIQLGNFDMAADEIMNSRYAQQVGDRAKRNYYIMKFDKICTKEQAKSYFVNQ